MMTSVLSTEEELKTISENLGVYLRLPFSGDSIPGAIMERVIAQVRGGEVLNTYDFVDVVDTTNGIGWQVKSTKSKTPVTWKRVKLANSDKLIADSRTGKKYLQHLGNSIIKFCNDHAKESFEKYDLRSIGFSRLIVFEDGTLKYFEKELCTVRRPKIFNEREFEWSWSKPKKTTKKEQLPALQGIHRRTGEKWFAWHGQGENQLHFSGEKNWWPTSANANDVNVVEFQRPNEKVLLQQLLKILEDTGAIDQ